MPSLVSRWTAVLAVSVGLLSSPASADNCGGVTGPPCEVASGSYHIALPKVAAAPQSGHPVVVHLHGWYASGRDVLGKNQSRMVAPATARGYVVVAPNALASPRFLHDWSVRDLRPRPMRDEVAFLTEVLADVARTVPIDRNRVLLSGFSRGGAMVWDIACHAPDSFAAYAPAAGSFWSPLPASCRGPVRLYHTHGWDDAIVPLEGRRLRHTAAMRGDIFAGLVLLREAGGCTSHAPDERRANADQWLRIWSASCEDGTDLRFGLFPGGHRLPGDWANSMLDWFEDAPSAATELIGQTEPARAVVRREVHVR